MKKLLCLFLTLALFVATFFSFGVSAVANQPQGTRLKDSDTYYYYSSSTKTLYINGKGDIPNLYNSSADIPWIEWDSSMIQNVVVEEGITSLGNYVFYGIRATSFVLPRTIKRIGAYALAYTNGMTSWEIPYGVETIDSSAFRGCRAMQAVSIPNSVKTIGSNAFDSCTSLQSVVIPESVNSIGSSAFYGCSSLENVTFASLTQETSIGSSAFMNCAKLTYAAIPKEASCNTKSFGYSSSTTKLDGFTLGVFSSSPTYSYAVGNGISYRILDSVPLSCGVEYKNSFSDGELKMKHHYTFTPDTTQEYSIYTLGACDTFGQIYLDDVLVDSNDDIDLSRSGFGITRALEAGNTYDIYVSTMNMVESYSLFIYPNNIAGFSVYSGSITKQANEGRVIDGKRTFSISLSMMSDFVLDVTFADGTQSSMCFVDYIAGNNVELVNTQSENPFACGANDAYISLDGHNARYDFIIEHSYESKVIAPTEDEDGYTLHSCINCDDSYKSDFVETTAITVTGQFVMDEDNFGSHENNVPYSHAKIIIGTREYYPDENGYWEVHTFVDCWARVENEYGNNRTVKILASQGDYDYGVLTLEPYDLNADGYVNAKDYVIYKRDKYAQLGENYWQFGNNYLIHY